MGAGWHEGNISGYWRQWLHLTMDPNDGDLPIVDCSAWNSHFHQHGRDSVNLDPVDVNLDPIDRSILLGRIFRLC